MQHDPSRPSVVRGFVRSFPTAGPRRLAFAAALVASLYLFAPTSARAQRNTSAERRTEARHADTMREMEMRRMEQMRDARPDSPAARLAFEQIGEDFKQMQIVNNEMMRAAFSGGKVTPLDYERVSKATAEINRRASRLKANLQLPPPAPAQPHEDEREIVGERELRSSLLALDELIMGFVNNPTFRKQAVIDAQHSARASRDLSAIIRLSQRIRQRAEKLKG